MNGLPPFHRSNVRCWLKVFENQALSFAPRGTTRVEYDPMSFSSQNEDVPRGSQREQFDNNSSHRIAACSDSHVLV